MFFLLLFFLANWSINRPICPFWKSKLDSWAQVCRPLGLSLYANLFVGKYLDVLFRVVRCCCLRPSPVSPRSNQAELLSPPSALCCDESPESAWRYSSTCSDTVGQQGAPQDTLWTRVNTWMDKSHQTHPQAIQLWTLDSLFALFLGPNLQHNQIHPRQFRKLRKLSKFINFVHGKNNVHTLSQCDRSSSKRAQ